MKRRGVDGREGEWIDFPVNPYYYSLLKLTLGVLTRKSNTKLVI